MEQPTPTIRQQASGITRFVVVQLIALVGWIIVQTFFTLSPLGSPIPFPVTLVIEAIWWTATLVIMYLLFRRIYSHFVQAVFDLEEANKRLRQRTNTFLADLGNQNNPDEERSSNQDNPGEETPSTDE